VHFLLLLALLAAPAAGRAPEGDELDHRLPPQEPVAAGPAEPLARRLCEALHALPAARVAACCGAAAAGRGLADECVRLLSGALRGGRVSVGPAAIEGCELASAATFAGCDWVTPLAPPAPPACRRVVEGMVPAGAACDSSVECRAGLVCLQVAAAGARTARVCSPPGGVGESCGAAADLLATLIRSEARAECAGYCNGGRCAAAVVEGGACLSSRQCAPAGHCAGGRCAPGAAARLGEACGGGACEEGAICLRGRCVARKGAGEPCGSPFECLAACNVPAGATTGTCGMRCPGSPAPAAAGTPAGDGR
jgi:hypothetical protein